MWISSRSIAAFTFVFTTAITVLAAEQPSAAKSDTYTWNGELVSFDTTADTMTVKVRVAYPDVVSQVKHIAAGERVWIVWSGVHDFSDAVRQVRRAESRSQISEDLVLPAELVSTEAPNQYITMRVKVPETSLAAIPNREARDMGDGDVSAPALHRRCGGGRSHAIRVGDHNHELRRCEFIDSKTQEPAWTQGDAGASCSDRAAPSRSAVKA